MSSAVMPCTANNQISPTETTNTIRSTHIVVLGVGIRICVHQNLDNLGMPIGCSQNECSVSLQTAPSAPALPASTHIVVLGVHISICVHQDLDDLGMPIGCSPKECGIPLHTAPSAPALPASTHIFVLGVH